MLLNKENSAPYDRRLLVPKVGEVEEGHKRIGNDHHPGFEVDVRGLLLRVHVPVQSQAKAHSSSNSVRGVVLEVTLVLAIQTLFRGLRIFQLFAHLVPHDGARPHDDEGRGHAAGEDDIHDHQQIIVLLPIYLRIDWRATCSPFLNIIFKSNLSH